VLSSQIKIILSSGKIDVFFSISDKPFKLGKKEACYFRSTPVLQYFRDIWKQIVKSIKFLRLEQSKNVNCSITATIPIVLIYILEK